MKSKWGALAALAAVLCPALGAAQEIDSGATAWMLTSTALVLLMTLPGLALREPIVGPGHVGRLTFLPPRALLGRRRE